MAALGAARLGRGWRCRGDGAPAGDPAGRSGRALQRRSAGAAQARLHPGPGGPQPHQLLPRRRQESRLRIRAHPGLRGLPQPRYGWFEDPHRPDLSAPALRTAAARPRGRPGRPGGRRGHRHPGTAAAGGLHRSLHHRSEGDPGGGGGCTGSEADRGSVGTPGVRAGGEQLCPAPAAPEPALAQPGDRAGEGGGGGYPPADRRSAGAGECRGVRLYLRRRSHRRPVAGGAARYPPAA